MGQKSFKKTFTPDWQNKPWTLNTGYEYLVYLYNLPIPIEWEVSLVLGPDTIFIKNIAFCWSNKNDKPASRARVYQKKLAPRPLAQFLTVSVL